MTFFWLIALGAIGVLIRFSIWKSFQTVGGFPYATLIVNVLGSFVIGFLYSLSEQQQVSWLTPNLYLGITIGLLGALTTFSSFSLDTMRLFQMGYVALGGVNIILNNLLCISFCYLGFKVAS